MEEETYNFSLGKKSPPHFPPSTVLSPLDTTTLCQCSFSDLKNSTLMNCASQCRVGVRDSLLVGGEREEEEKITGGEGGGGRRSGGH